MNNQNFNQSGGFPIKTQTLDEMQKAWSLLNVLGDLAGNFSIISGCNVTGATVSNGAVFINGEVFEFRGGQLGTTVIIVTEVTPKEFKDGTDKDVLYIRYVTFGIGVGSFAWADFKRAFPTKDIPAALNLKEDKTTVDLLIDRIEALEARPPSNIPLYGIILFDRPANEIPPGWAEYIPLRGRTAVGHDANYTQGTDQINHNLNILGYAGGTREHKLTQAEIANYNLNRNVGFHMVQPGPVQIWAPEPGGYATMVTNSGGGDKPHNNMQPNRIIHYIQRIV